MLGSVLGIVKGFCESAWLILWVVLISVCDDRERRAGGELGKKLRGINSYAWS